MTQPSLGCVSLMSNQSFWLLWSEQTCPRAYVAPHAFITNQDECPLTDQVPAGSRCHYACLNGHALTGSAEVNCGSDGQWESMFPHCEGIYLIIYFKQFVRTKTFLQVLLGSASIWRLYFLVLNSCLLFKGLGTFLYNIKHNVYRFTINQYILKIMIESFP